MDTNGYDWADNDAYELISSLMSEKKKSEGHRPKWVMDILGDRSVLSCALDVHMTTSGSYDRSYEDQKRDVKVLIYVLKSWRESLHFTKEFDDAVRNIIKTTINEFSLSETIRMIG